MNYIFTTMNCNISCPAALPAVMLANCSLPIGEKIWEIDVHSGDSRINHIKKGGYLTPTLITTRGGVIEEYGKTNEGRTEKVMVKSALDFRHYLALLFGLKYW